MHMKKFMAEFKQFALRGNVLDMAVGVIIGGAFTGIITALTENFINPILDFLIRGTRYTAQDIAGFGSNFLGAVINFIIMAFILFCLIKGINKLMTIGQKKRSSCSSDDENLSILQERNSYRSYPLCTLYFRAS